MEKVLITGGLGTIGSCITAQCVKRGYDVTIIDDYSIGVENNLLYYLNDEEVKKIKIIKGSILNEKLVDEHMKDKGLCFHMAALLGTLRVVRHPYEMIKTNINGTHNVLEGAKKHNVKIVVPSTSMVYGNNPKIMVSENDDCFVGGNLNKSLWWYAITKMADECTTRALLFDESITALIIRPFNIVGPIQSALAGFVIPRFISSAIMGKSIPVYGSGEQTRSFVWTEDFVEALFKLIDKNVWNETVNIGSTYEIKIIDLAKRIIEKTKSGSEIIYVNPDRLFKGQFVEINGRIPCIKKLTDLTGTTDNDFKNVDFILDKFIEYYKTVKDENIWTYKPDY